MKEYEITIRPIKILKKTVGNKMPNIENMILAANSKKQAKEFAQEIINKYDNRSEWNGISKDEQGNGLFYECYFINVDLIK